MSQIRLEVHTDETPNDSSSILVRTSKFLKRVSNIRHKTKRSIEISDSTHEAAVFAARSLALGRKSFGFSQPVLGVHSRDLRSDRMGFGPEDDSDVSPRSSNVHRPPHLITSSPRQRQSVDWPRSSPAQTTTAPTPPQKAVSAPSALPNGTRHRTNSSWSRSFGDKDKHKGLVSSPTTSPLISSPANGLPQPSSLSPSPSRGAAQPDGLPRCSEPPPAPSPISHNQRLSIATPRSPSAPIAGLSRNTTNDVSHPPRLSETFLNPEFDAKRSPISKPHMAAEPPLPAAKLRMSQFGNETRSQSLPSRHTISPSTHPAPSVPKPPVSAPTDVSTPESELQRQRSLHLRLASLPPPMMARYTAEGSARLTPSILPRPTPRPILNLPLLPDLTSPTPRTDNSSGDVRQGRSRGAPLRSMPALPLTGPRDDENPEAEEEGSDSSDDGEDEEGDDSGVRDEGGSEDEDADGEQNASANASRFELPRVLTSPFALSFSSKVTGAPSHVSSDLNTSSFHIAHSSPGAGPSSQPLDYFSVPKQQQPQQEHLSDAETLRTPRPSDFIPSSKLSEIPSRPNVDLAPRVLDATGPGTIPKIIPIPPTPTSPVPTRRTPRITRPSTGPGESSSSTSLQSRPSLYHHASKSMVDLSPHSRYEEKSPERTPTPMTSTTTETMRPVSELHSSTPSAPTLKRQRSLPMYKPDSEPPPYPTFLSGNREAIIQPREEEGREPLPSYSNSILLVGMMPRKMEFTSPGVQAKERKWRRVIVVLEGTVLRIYRTHGAGVSGKGGKVGEWWERTVGVGDWSTSDGVGGLTGSQGGVRVSAIRDRERRLQLQTQGDTQQPPQLKGGEQTEHSEEELPLPPPKVMQQEPSPSKSRFHLPSSILHPARPRDNNTSANGTPNASRSSLAVPLGTGSTRSRLSFDIPRERAEEPLSSTANRHSMDVLRTPPTSRTSSSRNLSELSPSPPSRSPISPRSRSSSNGAPSTSSSMTSATSASTVKNNRVSMFFSDTNQPAIPNSKDLLRSYTLQHAESGLASDYVKRKNVLRIRMEGEQFLLQARDVAGVIDWIEAIQAATNIALDLDERPMPKGPLFPRRRRRRHRRPETAGQDATTSHAAS